MHETSQEDDQGPIGPGETGAGDLSAHHGQLVAQHQDLGILGRSIRPVDANDLENAPDKPVEERQGHGARASLSSFWLVKLRRGVSGPFRSWPTPRGWPSGRGIEEAHQGKVVRYDPDYWTRLADELGGEVE